MKGLVAVVIALVVAATTGASASGPPSGLTKTGQVLWNFESLLRQTFGNRHICSSGRWRQNFTGGDLSKGACAPLATYSPYFYVFDSARGSAFHVSSKKEVGGFGNYPIAVLIRGRPVACNTRETRFLVLYRSTAFTLGCLRAGYVVS